MNKLIFSIFFFVSIFTMKGFAQSQDYSNAIGIRLGSYNGVNYKTFLDASNALDFNLSFRNNNSYKQFVLTGLYEVHNNFNIPEVAGLKWYYGAGASVGSYKKEPNDGNLFLSVDGVLGVDYKFTNAPINLSLDFRPRLEITPNTNLRANDLGLAIRYVF